MLPMRIPATATAGPSRGRHRYRARTVSLRRYAASRYLMCITTTSQLIWTGCPNRETGFSSCDSSVSDRSRQFWLDSAFWNLSLLPGLPIKEGPRDIAVRESSIRTRISCDASARNRELDLNDRSDTANVTWGIISAIFQGHSNQCGASRHPSAFDGVFKRTARAV
jgi:hypothetical protein